MARLPQPGGDVGNWGEVLNDFLNQSHNDDGSLKNIPQSKILNLQADLTAKANTSAIPTTPGQVGAEPAGLSQTTKDALNVTTESIVEEALEGFEGGRQNIRLDALAAGKRAKATLAGNESETAEGTFGAVSALVATSTLSLGTVTFTDAGDIVTTSVAHGFVAGDVISFGTVTTTTGVTAGDPIFVREVVSATTFTLTTSSSPGGSVRTLTGDGSSVALYRRERAYDRHNTRVSPFIRFTETRPAQSAATYPRWEYVSADPTIITFAPGTSTYTGMRAEFEYEGSKLGILLRNSAGLRGRVYVDGRYLGAFSTAAMTAAGIASNAVGRYPVTFTTTRKRLIALEFDGTSEFAGIEYEPSRPLIFPTSVQKGPRVLVVGDSFTEGEGAGTSKTYVRWLGHLMGWRDVWRAGSGGVGYYSDASSGRPSLVDRYANDIIAQAPNIVVIALGLNDLAAYGSVPSTVVAAATEVWDAVLTGLPSAELVIIGPWPNNGGVTPSTGLVSMDTALAAEALTRGIRYISPISEGWQFTLADATHPDPAGHEYIAWRVAGHLSVPYIAA